MGAGGPPERMTKKRDSGLQASINSQTAGAQAPPRRRLGPIGQDVIGSLNNRNASAVQAQTLGAADGGTESAYGLQ